MIKFLFLITISIFFISCANVPTYTSKVKKYFVNPSTTIDFKDITYDLTSKLCSKLKNEDIIYITDFVNEENLKNKSKLGFLLANQTKVNIQDEQCVPNILIQDLQLANAMKVSYNGSRILSRDIDEIKVKTIDEEKKILTGSYIITTNQIILFLKLVNLNDGTTIASTTTTRILNDEFKQLEGLKTSKEVKKENKNHIYKPLHL
jgi:hypothetical protein